MRTSRKPRYHWVSESFTSPEQAMDIVKKMVRLGDLIIDNTNPAVDSYPDAAHHISADPAPSSTRARAW